MQQSARPPPLWNMAWHSHLHGPIGSCASHWYNTLTCRDARPWCDTAQGCADVPQCPHLPIDKERAQVSPKLEETLLGGTSPHRPIHGHLQTDPSDLSTISNP